VIQFNLELVRKSGKAVFKRGGRRKRSGKSSEKRCLARNRPVMSLV